MIHRVRDKIRQFKPQQVISYKEWEFIQEQFRYASSFMQKDNPAYNILLEEIKNGEQIILENRIHEVREIRIISDIMQKIFITPRKEQLDELIGQLKFIKDYLTELQSWIDRKIELERLEGLGKVTINRNKEKQDEKF